MALDIEQITEDLECCIANTAWQTANNELLGIPDNCVQKAVLMNYKFKIIRNFIPAGTVLVPSYINTATLDIGGAGISPFPAFYTGNIIVNGSTIAFFAGDYADIDELIQDITDAINASGMGYSATNNGDGTITLTATGGISFAFLSASIEVFDFYILTTADFDTDLTATAITLSTDGAGVNVISYGNGTVIDANVYNYQGDDVTTDLYPGLQFTNPGGGGTDNWYKPAIGSAYFPERDLIYFTFFDSVSTLDTNTGTITNVCIDLAGTIVPPGCTPGKYIAAGIVYNPFYSQLFFTLALNGLARIDALGTFAVVDPTFAGSNFSITCNTQNGELFIAPNNTTDVIRVIDPLGTPQFIRIPVPGSCGANPQTITYREGSTLANGRIFYVSNPVNLNRIKIINPITETVIQYDASAPGEAGVTSMGTVYWSNEFNVLFVGAGTGILIYRYNEAIPDTLFFVKRFDLAPDARTSDILKFNDNTDDVSSPGGSVMYIGNPGLAHDTYGIIKRSDPFTINGVLGEPTPPVIQSDADNCSGMEALIASAVQQLKEACRCAPCGTDIQDIGGSGNSNGVITATVYYGRSTDDALDATGVALLTAINKPNFSGIYNYAALADNYIYFAYPAAWGTPSRFQDLIGGFDVVMDTPYGVIILGIIYTVYRSFNILGGAQSMNVIQ